MEQQFDYDIFLSYRHKNLDSIITQKTFHHVESYRLPASLRRKGFRDIRRAFRDTEELPVSRILTDTIDKALCSTNCLLLVCSTDTPSSEWVDREVATFIELGRAEHIYPLLISGDPETSFPPSLKRVPDIMDRVMDARVPGNAPKKIMAKAKPELLKIIAGVTGCPLRELQREHGLRRARRFLAKALAAAAAFALAGTVSLWLMQQARKWSDRYRVLKKKGLNDSQIFKTFSEPVNMRVFAYNKKGYIDTTMTPDDSIRYYKSILRTAFVAMEPGTGHVKAYVGGPDYRYFKYDNVRQGKRQVGSTIKPFLYTLAMQEGLTPCTKVTNVPVTFLTPGGETWTPRSTDKEEWIGKTVTLKWGLTNSSNNISAFLMKQYGPEAMADMMKRMGIQSHVDEVPSLCVGPADLTLWEMVAAYNTFPSRGVYVTPLFVTRIEDRQGNVLSEFTNRKREAIAESTAYLMVNLMEGVVQGGTASRLRYRYNLTGEIAGKTGTTNDNSDGWFIGYTPTLVAGVWTGAEDRQVHFQSITYGQGAHMSLPTWGIFMKKVLADGTLGISADDRFVAPAGEFSGLDCTGGDNDASEVYQSKEEEYYFE